jgi:WD40 repeat protein
VYTLLFSSVFSSLISIDHLNVVNVWDLLTGKNIFRFTATHDESISSAVLDDTQKRLITTAMDGFCLSCVCC